MKIFITLTDGAICKQLHKPNKAYAQVFNQK
jgi:hypothetical protein